MNRELDPIWCIGRGVALMSGLLALGLVGGPLSWVGFIACPFVVIGPLWSDRLGSAKGTLGWGLLLSTLLLAVPYRADIHVLMGLVLVGLQVYGSVTRTGSSRELRALLLAALMLVGAAARTDHMLFLLFAVGWTVGGVVCLVRGEGRLTRLGPEIRLVGLVSICSIIGFLWLPRSHRAVSAHVGVTGFDDNVELGEHTSLLEDRGVLFRAEVEGAVGDRLYLRGMAFDQFDGRRWSTNGEPGSPEFSPPGPAAIDVRIVGWVPAGGVLLVPGEVVDFDGLDEPPQRVDGSGWRTSLPGPLDYRVRSYLLEAWRLVERGGLAASDRERWTVLPANYDARLRDLASEVAGDTASAQEKLRVMEAWLRAEFAYARKASSSADPMAEFLLESRTGWCEYFATALVVMARSQGIPARLVAGFSSTERAEDGAWIFRRSHAHAWVEAHLPGRGWMTLDATPEHAEPVGLADSGSDRRDRPMGERLNTAWSRWVLNYDASQQAELKDNAMGVAVQLVSGRNALFVITSLCVLWGWARWGRWRPRRGQSPDARSDVVNRVVVGRVAAVHARAWHQLRRVGWQVPRSLPPLAAAKWVAARVSNGDALVALAWLHYRVRYGQCDDDDAAPEAEHLLQQSLQISPP